MFGQRLKLARKKAGLSLDRLVEAIDGTVSKQAISKYEREQMMPGTEVLMAIAKALDVTLEYLLSDQVAGLEGVDFRKKVRTSAKDRARVEASVIDRMERYLAVETILDLPSVEWRQPQLGSSMIQSLDSAERLADELRNCWELGEDAIPDMTLILEDNGIKVLMIELPNSVSGLTCFVTRRDGNDSLPVIVVNSIHNLERRRFTLAHELAHRIFHSRHQLSEREEEKAAQRFSGSFLMPAAHLRRETGEHRGRFGYQEFIELKRMYRVSAAALAMRLHQIGVIDKSSLSTLFQTVGRTWRTEEPEPIEPESQRGQIERPVRFERLTLRALAEEYISPAKAMELMQVPLAQIGKAMSGPDAHSHQ